jgi:cytochrome c oxidase cbb3-type subunit I/II
MPAYPHLFEDVLDTTTTRRKIEAMRTMGVPYAEDFPAMANADITSRSTGIVAGLKKDGIEALKDREIIALIAYLQRVGTDIKAKTKEVAANNRTLIACAC